MASTCAVVLFVLTCAFCTAHCSSIREDEKHLLETDKRVDLEEPVSVKILLAGKSGIGKSTIVNALVGMDVARINDDVVSVTEVERIVAAKNGVQVYITDIPDLGDFDHNETLNLGEDIDLFLFCLKMTERVDSYHMKEVKTITNVFGADIWQKGLFVLTFANEINEEDFNFKMYDWESGIRKRIKRLINPNVAEKIPFVPAGFKEPQLPDRPNWLSELLIQGTGRMGFKARIYMALLNIERIGNGIDEKKFAEEMCKSPEQPPPVTQYTWKQERESRWVLILKSSCCFFGAVFFYYAIVIIVLRYTKETIINSSTNRSIVLGYCAGSFVVTGWLVCYWIVNHSNVGGHIE